MEGAIANYYGSPPLIFYFHFMNIILKFVLAYVVAVMHIGAVWLGMYLFYPNLDILVITIGMLGVSNALGWQLGLLVEKLTHPKPKGVGFVMEFHREWDVGDHGNEEKSQEEPKKDPEQEHSQNIDPGEILESATVQAKKPRKKSKPKSNGKKHSPETIEKIRAASFAREKEKREQRERIAKTKETADKKKARKATLASKAPVKVAKVPARKKPAKK